MEELNFARDYSILFRIEKFLQAMKTAENCQKFYIHTNRSFWPRMSVVIYIEIGVFKKF